MLSPDNLGVQFFCWYRILSKDNLIPISNRNLDRAMKKAIEQGNISYEISNSLNFSNTKTGLKCIELPDLEQAAMNAQIIGYKPPEYTHDIFLITQKTANILLERTGKTKDIQSFVSKVLESLS